MVDSHSFPFPPSHYRYTLLLPCTAIFVFIINIMLVACVLKNYLVKLLKFLCRQTSPLCTLNYSLQKPTRLVFKVCCSKVHNMSLLTFSNISTIHTREVTLLRGFHWWYNILYNPKCISMIQLPL